MPIQTATGVGASYDDELANSQLNESTDTVHGQLQKHTDFKTPVMQRVSQQAHDKAADRGLGNSTIAQRSAIGAVVDKAGEFATKDAELYANRRTENQRAGTHLTATAMGNQSAHKIAQERNEAGLEQQRLSNEGQLTNTRLQTDSSERVAAQRVAGENSRHDASVASQQVIANADNASREAIATGRNEVTAAANHLDNQTRMDVAQLQQNTEMLRQRNDATQSAWDNFQRGISGIDPNASAASQTTLYTRLKENFQARVEFNEGLFSDEVEGYQLPTLQPSIPFVFPNYNTGPGGRII